MQVIPPLRTGAFVIDPSMLTSTTAAEPAVGEAAWASGTTYAVGDRTIIGAPSSTVTISIASPGVVTWSGHGLPDGTAVRITTTGALPTGLVAGTLYYVVQSTTTTFQLSAESDGASIVTTGSQSGAHTATAHIHRIYESQVATNDGNPPARDDGTKWVDVGPTNKWACFDFLRNTQTIVASPLTVVITPGERVDAIGLVGLVGDSVTVTVTSVTGGGTVYTYTQSLNGRGTTTWYEYFFGAFRQIGAIARFDLPPFVDAVITVTVTRASGNVRCGGIILGRQSYLGKTQYSAEADAINYSVIQQDDFGNTTLVPRRSVPTTTQQVRCDKAAVNRMLQTKDDLNAVPALWSGLDDSTDGYFEALLIVGVYTRWLITVDRFASAIQQIELKEI